MANISNYLVMTMDQKRAFDIVEICERTGLGRSKIYEQIGIGRLVARKVGRRTLVLERDLKDFLEALPVIQPNAAEKA